jgi:xylan 1,4-beta-xylosidase
MTRRRKDGSSSIVVEQSGMPAPDLECFDAVVLERIQYYTRIKKVVEYLAENIADRLTLERAASIACMEKTAFSKCFKKRIGISFSEYLRSYRIATAIDAMRHSDYSITEIAYRTGFSSSGAFARVFKQVTSCCPSDYRREMLRSNGFLVTSRNRTDSAKDRALPARI